MIRFSLYEPSICVEVGDRGALPQVTTIFRKIARRMLDAAGLQRRTEVEPLDLPGIVMGQTCVRELVAETTEGTFIFDARDRGVGWVIATDKSWEDGETVAIKTIVGAGDLVLDVGANIGWYTVVLSRLVGKHGCVVAFEPNPRNFQLLMRNISVNSVSATAHAHQIALLDKKATIDFELSDSNFGDHRIRFRPPSTANEPERYGESTRQVINVSGEPLDAFLRENYKSWGDRRIGLVKMDCQGAEVAILRGAAETLPRVEQLVTEFWPYGMRRAGHDPQEFIGVVKNNFARFAVIKNNRPPLKFEPISLIAEHAANVSWSTDYLFTK